MSIHSGGLAAMNPRRLVFRMAIILIGLYGLVAAGTIGSANAQQGHHGEGHDELHHWYLTLRDWKGRPCCDGTDCRPTRSRYRNGRLEVLVDGEWTKVPAHKILSESSPDLRTHVCSPGPETNYPRGFIFCVVLGPGV
ncbi:MAG: hypothetical protein AAF346_10230 [Pseudomonadota bacterium]